MDLLGSELPVVDPAYERHSQWLIGAGNAEEPRLCRGLMTAVVHYHFLVTCRTATSDIVSNAGLLGAIATRLAGP